MCHCLKLSLIMDDDDGNESLLMMLMMMVMRMITIDIMISTKPGQMVKGWTKKCCMWVNL